MIKESVKLNKWHNVVKSK